MPGIIKLHVTYICYFSKKKKKIKVEKLRVLDLKIILVERGLNEVGNKNELMDDYI